MDGMCTDIGGYNYEIFLNLSNRERLEYTCSICGLILNKPHECSNGHLYCLSCITEWSKRGNKTCPICRVHPVFVENYSLGCKIDSKYVRCETNLCPWKGRLERLNRHVKEIHSSHSNSFFSTEKDMLIADDRIEFHKSAKEVDQIHHQKRESLIRKIKKLEKNKRNELLSERESAQSLPIATHHSPLYTYRPLTNKLDLDSPGKFQHVQWEKSHVSRGLIDKRIQDVEIIRQNRREQTHQKVALVERRKRDNIYRKLHEIEKRREDNRQTSEQRILQIENKMKEEKEAFHKRLLEKERRNKDGMEALQRRISVIKMSMKR